MKMQPADPGEVCGFECRQGHSQARTACAGVVLLTLHFRMLGIDAIARADLVRRPLHRRTVAEPLPLGIENDVVRMLHERLDVCIRVGRRVDEDLTPELASAELGLVRRTCCRAREFAVDVLEGTPQRKPLERENDAATRTLLNGL